MLSVFPGASLSVQPRQLNQDLVSFGSTVAEENLSRACIKTEFFGENSLVRNSIKVATMGEFFDLLFDTVDPNWVAVAD